MICDLHLHSTCSDGTRRPAQVAELAAGAGLSFMALTDHDSVDGNREAQARAHELGLHFLCGIELSCETDRPVHVLGYGIDPENEELALFCREYRVHRRDRARKMVEKLNAAGLPLDYDHVLSLARGAVGRPHVARALVEAGLAQSVQEAFQKYLLPGKIGYVPKKKLSVTEGCALIRGAGGVPVLAHPMQLHMGDMALETLVRYWQGQGLCGLEVYHPSAENHKAARLLRLARQLGLAVTGGSDFHGPEVRAWNVGENLERWTTAEEDVRDLYARIGLKDLEETCRP